MLSEFKKFLASGNVLDWAVGVVIGTSFGNVVNSFVNDIIMPPISSWLGKMDMQNWFINLSGHSYNTLSAAKAAGAATINYGEFITLTVDFIIDAFIVFLVANRVLHFANTRASATASKECPYCCSLIPLRATRCPKCTSHL